jgi:hypothetical protein
VTAIGGAAWIVRGNGQKRHPGVPHSKFVATQKSASEGRCSASAVTGQETGTRDRNPKRKRGPLFPIRRNRPGDGHGTSAWQIAYPHEPCIAIPLTSSGPKARPFAEPSPTGWGTPSMGYQTSQLPAWRQS